ncbi:MAG: ATP-dependent helicase HrpB [Proteobacteria bacterium]|nr:ATP-dependent helicase HrpB [Pseudomonadota bacterium]
MTSKPLFPVNDALPALIEALSASNQCLLVAPPGAGKTTQVPLVLLNSAWLQGQGVLMLEPRRLAARSAAAFMARQLGEEVGQTVGYSVRMERKVSKATRIEVVTEGILTRRLQQDPELSGIGLVIFDEFHERNLNSDLGLALLRDSQQGLREDIRLLVMSATLDVKRLRSYFDHAREIVSEGRHYPVEHHYLDRDPSADKIGAILAQTVEQALSDSEGDLLLFFAGVGEIERAREQLQASLAQQPVEILPLHGSLSLAEQDKVMRPATAGCRKIILATNIAETSLTIDGVRVVIDTGQARETRYQADSGMTRLQTVRITADAATQRCGRAGRQAPGHCYRLWSKHTQAGLVPERIPEILRTDLTSLVLELACWGITDVNELHWVDEPPSAHVRQAVNLLQQLQALESEGRITTLGKEMASLGMSPRLACMLLNKKETEDAWLACVLAAAMEERDFLRGEINGSVETRIQLLASNSAGRAGKRIMDIAKRHAQRLRIKPAVIEAHNAGRLLAIAFPDRIARARGQHATRYLLANGRGAQLHNQESAAAGEYIVITDIDDRSGDSRIFRYAQLSGSDVEAIAEGQSVERHQLSWDEKAKRIIARSVTSLGAIELNSKKLNTVQDEQAIPIIIDVINKTGLTNLPWTDAARNLQVRSQLAATLEDGWPDVSDQALLVDGCQWLHPYLAGVRSQADIDKLDMAAILKSQLDWNQRQWLEQNLPERYKLPNGRHARIDYNHQPQPLMRSRLQDFFGLSQQPTLANGRIEVVIELLSPANRPVQRTQNLPGFWSGSYAEVRKEMKGRYPKHDWPEDPGAT